MPESAPPAPVPGSAAPAAPAVPAPGTAVAQPGAPPPAPVVDIFAAAKAKALAAVTGQPVPAPAKPPVAAPPETPKIEMDAATLKKLTALSKADRENKAKIAELEAKAPDAATFAEVKKLYAEGKRMEAIAKLSGKEAVAEMEALMADYLNAPTDAAADDAKDALAAKVEELAAKDAARDKADADADAARAAAEEKARGTAVTAFAHQVLDAAKAADGSATFELCARAENRAEAADAALEIVKALAFDRKLENVTQEQAAELYREAYKTVEAEYEELGKRYTRGSPRSVNVPFDPRRPATPSPGPRTEPESRPSPVLSKPPLSTQVPARSLTHAEAKRKALDSVRGYST